MAFPVNIESIIRQQVVESSRIEYKSDWNPEPIIRTITAFANDFDNMGGGYIFIGIAEENGMPKFPISGLRKDSIDSIQKDLLEKCNLIEPRYIPIVEPYVIDGKDILVIWVPGGDERPYKCPDHIYSDKSRKSAKSYYIRKLSNTIKANAREEIELIDLARKIPFDDRVNYEAEIGDLRSSLISEYLYTVESALYEESLTRGTESVAADMKIVKGPKESRKPVNVGLMFFNERPDNFFPYCRIEVVNKPDPTGMEMKEKTFEGPLNRQLQDALDYIKNFVIEEYVTKNPNRPQATRVFNWPYVAVREALTNAVYHRSYQIYEPITVTITPEKLEILSLPGPDRSISDSDLKKGIMVSNRYRNRRIGDFLKDLRMAEGRNTGMPLVLNAMKQNGSPAPKFQTDQDRSYLRVIFPIHPVFLREDAPASNGKNGKPRPMRRNRETLIAEIIAALTKKGPMSMGQLASELGYTKIPDSLRKTIKEIVEKGVIQYQQPEKPNSRNQKLFIAGK